MAIDGGTAAGAHRNGPGRWLRAAWRLATDPDQRTMQRLAWFGRGRAFQPWNTTRANRYPVIFGFVRDRLGAEAPLSILSFGCSTGEEVFMLAGYFPNARIRGVDINPRNIAAARARPAAAPDPRLSFVQSAAAAAETPEAYDAIFAWRCRATAGSAGGLRGRTAICALPLSTARSRNSPVR